MYGSKKKTQNKSYQYQIIVLGIIRGNWSDWLGGMTITTTKKANSVGVTILNGIFPDQAALRGLMIKLWDLNATLIEVQLINPSTGQAYNPMEVYK